MISNISGNQVRLSYHDIINVKKRLFVTSHNAAGQTVNGRI